MKNPHRLAYLVLYKTLTTIFFACFALVWLLVFGMVVMLLYADPLGVLIVLAIASGALGAILLVSWLLTWLGEKSAEA